MHKFVFATLAAGACLLATSAFADEAGGKDQVAAVNSFATLDRNGDRRISRSEAGFDRRLSNTFAEIDTDGDGFVSLAEFSAADKPAKTLTGNLTPR